MAWNPSPEVAVARDAVVQRIIDLATGRVPSHPNGVPPQAKKPKKRKVK